MPANPLVAVVDDDPASRRSLGRVLRVGGFAAAIYASAEEFLASPQAPPPIALLLDLQLPGLSGLELLRRLRSEGSALPVVVITANEEARPREEAEALGCLAYLVKPCDAGTILALLRPLVPGVEAGPR